MIVGFDPGPNDCHAVCREGRNWYNDPEHVTVAIIEWPEAQGRQIRLEPLLATRGRAQSLADRLLLAGAEVYIPSRAVIMRQLGYNPRRDGGGDAWLRRYLVGMGHKCGRGTELNSSHARAAFAAALWNYRDPRNARYKYKG